MKKNKKWIALITVFCVFAGALSVSAEEADQQAQSEGEDGGSIQLIGGQRPLLGGSRGTRGDGGRAVETDEAVLKVLADTPEKFVQLTYEDPDNGTSLEYSLFIPKDYNVDEKYPLVMFIPDATGAGKSAKEIVEQYYGADIFATDEEQQKHPSFVFVPAFSEVVVNGSEASSEINTALKLLKQLTNDYSIDTDRLYATGQSMGCMTSLYLNGTYPGYFAASLFVSGQWDISILKPLENEKFFYITAGGDESASGGQTEVMEMFDKDGIPYSYAEWSAQESAEKQNESVEKMLEKGNKANMIRFTTGTVLNGADGMEHMYSFNYAFKISAVRDWLFEQSKDDNSATANAAGKKGPGYESSKGE